MSELDGIYEHLNELRTRVLRIVIVVGIIAVFLMTFHLESISYNEVILYYPIPEPLDNIAAQLTNYFEINLVPEGVQLIQTAPGQAFFAQIYIAGLVGLVAGTPVIIKEIGELAEECDAKFNTKSVISIELAGVTQDDLKKWGYPDSKLLPIPGK